MFYSTVFYSFGSLRSILFAFWLQKAYSSPKDDPDLGAEEKRIILEGGVSKAPVSDIFFHVFNTHYEKQEVNNRP
ncbi:unnamed protein product [Lathyrus sativus]|nr:unnamed protein product [Lathyrus sativus]